MKRLIPDTIVGRTLLVLIVGLTLSHVLSMAMYFTDRDNAVMLAGGEHIGERIVTVTRLVERAPSDERRQVVNLADDPTLRVSLGPRSILEDDRDQGWQTEVLRRSFIAHLGKLGDRNFKVWYADTGVPDVFLGGREKTDRKRSDTRTILVSLQLPDGNWLNFAAPIGFAESFWTFRIILSMSVMIVAIIVFSAAVVRHLTKPLRVFSRAARRLGLDIHAPSLPEAGPREVREATRAFNDMQRRIRRLVDDRTRMLAAVSHDLRTPITLLRLRAEFVDDAEEQKKTMATLDEMESMITSILAFARDEAESEERRMVDLSALLGSICDDMADAGLPVAFDAGGKLTYECGPTALRRALQNLIENAVKYGSNARVSLIDTGSHIEIEVEDDGPGIPESELENALEPFYRVEGSRSRETGGMGLGLSIAKSIVNFHGGEIRLSNRQGGGLTVSVGLPR